jgi:hypothetical protein
LQNLQNKFYYFYIDVVGVVVDVVVDVVGVVVDVLVVELLVLALPPLPARFSIICLSNTKNSTMLNINNIAKNINVVDKFTKGIFFLIVLRNSALAILYILKI